MKLMIIESPGKREKLEAYLQAIDPSSTWRVRPSIGHIRDLPPSGQNENEITSGINSNYSLRYELTERGGEVVTRLETDVGNASEVYIATDPDREGESIAWHIKEAVGIKNYTRITFNEVTKERIEQSLANPGRIDMKMVAAQEARRGVDRLFGYLVSNELRRQTGMVLSAGRVQSPAVYLVVLREREIRAFTSTTHYGAELSFASAKPGSGWTAEWITKAGFVTEDQPYFMDRHFAEQVAKCSSVVVVDVEDKPRLRNPPAPFISSSLQQAASNRLNWNPDVSMKVAQALFDQGLITYHRTDNPNVSEESMPALRAAAQAMGLPVVDKRRTWKAKENAQEGHPGITPTHWEVETAGETPEQQALYTLIRNRAIASQLQAARYDTRTVVMNGSDPSSGKQLVFGARGETLVDAGWLRLQKGDSAADEDEEDLDNPVPALQVGQVLKPQSGKLIEERTRAPRRYTKASLVGAMEKQGIGRPSTYASILLNISTREYVIEKDRFLQPTETGELVIKLLEGKFSFLQLSYTSELEEKLDQIATGQTQFKAVMESVHQTLASELAALQSIPTFKKVEPVYDCPECGKPLHRIAKSANGPYWACTGCPTKLPDAKGVPGKRKVVELSEHKCTVCSSPLVHRVKKVRKGAKGGYNFWGCSVFACKAMYPNKKDDTPDLQSLKMGS